MLSAKFRDRVLWDFVLELGLELHGSL